MRSQIVYASGIRDLNFKALHVICTMYLVVSPMVLEIDNVSKLVFLATKRDIPH